MLVRDAGFEYSSMGNHDYFAMPEIVEDICNDFQKEFGVSIHALVRNSSGPCVVKFWSTTRLGRDCLEAALYYAYLRTHGKPMILGSNTCYDAGGQTIRADQIVQVERLHESAT